MYFAVNHSKSGGIVHLGLYVSMPHVFPIFEGHSSSETCYKELGKFIRNVTGDNVSVATRMEVINVQGEIDLQTVDLESYRINFSQKEVESPVSPSAEC